MRTWDLMILMSVIAVIVDYKLRYIVIKKQH